MGAVQKRWVVVGMLGDFYDRIRALSSNASSKNSIPPFSPVGAPNLRHRLRNQPRPEMIALTARSDALACIFMSPSTLAQTGLKTAFGFMCGGLSHSRIELQTGAGSRYTTAQLGSRAYVGIAD